MCAYANCARELTNLLIYPWMQICNHR